MGGSAKGKSRECDSRDPGSIPGPPSAHKSDPMTGRSKVVLPRIQRDGHRRPPGFIHNPDESDYHKRARGVGIVNGRRIA